jgi:hypothetical protein
VKNSKMGLGGSGARNENSKMAEKGPLSHGKVANVTVRNGVAKVPGRSDALASCCKNSPVKCKGK